MADSTFSPPPLNPISQSSRPFGTRASQLNSSPGLLPAPPTIRRPLRTPASPSVPGRASASESWINDKSARASVPTKIQKIPGRASLSQNWVRDKLLASASTVSATASTPTTYLPTKAIGASTTNLPVKRNVANTGVPSADSCSKKARYEFLSEDSGSESEPEDSFYAGVALVMRRS